MHRSVPYIAALFLAACVAACGGSKSSATTNTIYDHPFTLAPAKTPMGGAIQGTTLKLVNAVSTFAGVPGIIGFGNYSTANGPPAKFNYPNDITTDGTSFYVADHGNHLIRKVSKTGVVTTLSCVDAVTSLPVGFNRPSGITTDGTNLYVADFGSNTIRIIEIATQSYRVTTIGSTSALAGSVDVTGVSPAATADVTQARFNQPIGITTDGVNLYVTDSGNHTVRRINILTRAVTTLAGVPLSSGAADGGQGVALFNHPGRITTDGTNLYLADFGNRTIRMIDILSGVVTTIAGASTPGTPEKISKDNNGTADGIGTSARFYLPNGITTDGTYLYVTDTYQNTIRRVDKLFPYNVTTISGVAKPFSDPTIGKGGSVDSPGTPSFFSPIGITTDGVSLYVADSENSTIRKIQ